MRVLALNFNQKGVGTYRRSFYFSRELSRAGHEVTMMTVSRDARFRRSVTWKKDWITESNEPRGEGPWFRLIEGPAWGYRALPGWGAGPLDIWGRVQELRGGNYDAVIGFEYHPNVSWPVYLTRGWKGFRFISDWCDWFGGSSNQFRGWKVAHRIDSYLEERIRLRADRVSVTSRLLFDRAVSIGIPASKIVHLPEGAATDYILPMDRKSARAQMKMPEDAPILLAVRNGDSCREVRVLGEVLRRIPGAFLLLVGSESTAALQLAERLGISSQLISSGWVSDENYPQLLSCADVCICPLEEERNNQARWPAKILDFLASGCATVTNAVGEVETLFRKSQVGVLAEHGDAEFAQEVADLLLDEPRRRSLGEAARRVMVAEWDWRVRGAAIVELVERKTIPAQLAAAAVTSC
ncbi:MAG TPA: glycosyltransferase [Verrucomicrobiae bacterium]|nr:glycosyltransferase [Verrucomicrobiae bacterium]